MLHFQNAEYCTTREAAEQMGVSLQSVRRWCDHGLLGEVVDRGPDKKPRYFIRADALEDFTPPSLDGMGWPAGKKRK